MFIKLSNHRESGYSELPERVRKNKKNFQKQKYPIKLCGQKFKTLRNKTNKTI